MAEKTYAFIKDGIVVNTVVFDDPSEELLLFFIKENNLDNIVQGTEKTVIGGTYDGTRFWLKQPYPSWQKNLETFQWESPVPRPTDGNMYEWDETTVSWRVIE
jgi:hypothetical protein